MVLMNSCSRYYLKILLVVVIAIGFYSCDEVRKNSTHQHVSNTSIKNGKTLAIQYCGSCHLLPDPSQLDATSWEQGVLPAMGPRLGIFNYGFQHYSSYKNDKDLDTGYYPPKPLLNNIEWQQIIDYYTALSPDTLPAAIRPAPIKTGLAVFNVETPSFFYPSPAISLIKFDTAATDRTLFAFDLATQKAYTFNHQLQLTQSIQTNASLVDADFTRSGIMTCNIGMINPNNGKYGKGQFIQKKADGSLLPDTTFTLGNLARPVQISSCDLNNDQQTDYLVCEFGHLNGALAWMENKGNGNFDRHVLRAQSGPIKAYVNDYNHDGLPDIWALFSQGDEGIFLFTNKGNGQFEETQILRFPPVYGSTYFEFADFNNDGHADIVYTCGDNADFSMVLKPYHGVYIFMNDGHNNFTEKYFYPINGCYKAMARDFDNDGDLDIATIAFFADYEKQPEEGFVYLENKGGLTFEPFTIEEAKKGRWLTMDAGDINGDGKIDLVLGNFSIRPSVSKPVADWKKGPPFLVLKNISKK